MRLSKTLHRYFDVSGKPLNVAVAQSKVVVIETVLDNPVAASGLDNRGFSQLILRQVEEGREKGFALVPIPFKSLCVEDPSDAIVIHKISDDKLAVAICSAVRDDSDMNVESEIILAETKVMLENDSVIVAPDPNGLTTYLVHKDKKITAVPPGDDRITMSAMRHVIDCSNRYMLYAMYMNSPNTRIVRAIDKKIQDRLGKGKKVRQFSKPIHYLRSNDEVEIMKQKHHYDSKTRNDHWLDFWKDIKQEEKQELGESFEVGNIKYKVLF